MKTNLWILAVGCAVAGVAFGAELPPLAGDGVSDDTAAIQARLDEGRSCVYLPPPRDHYVISKTLKIGSGQELRLENLTVRGCRMVNRLDKPIKFLLNRGRIDNVTTNNMVFFGKWEDSRQH